nr:SBBP repeat-containing protein [Candidatus Gracilibacteria bacterium]
KTYKDTIISNDLNYQQIIQSDVNTNRQQAVELANNIINNYVGKGIAPISTSTSQQNNTPGSSCETTLTQTQVDTLNSIWKSYNMDIYGGNSTNGVLNWDPRYNPDNYATGFTISQWCNDVYIVDTYVPGAITSDLVSGYNAMNNLSELRVYDADLATSISYLSQLNKLFLQQNGNTVPYDSSIRTMTKLRGLILRNYGSTIMSSSIGNLINLTYLDLWQNGITSLPVEIGNLVNLSYFQLGNNALTSLPTEIGNLHSLSYLNLQSSSLTSLPAAIGNLTNLKELWVNNNGLTSLPAEIGNLISLKKLYLNNNSISGALTSGIGNLINLEQLDLYGSQLTSLPTTMGNLTKLTYLYLAGNYSLGNLAYYFDPTTPNRTNGGIRIGGNGTNIVITTGLSNFPISTGLASDDMGYKILKDTGGNIYVYGVFQGTSNLFGENLTSSGLNDIFIAKLDSNGNKIWVKKAGGSSNDNISGMVLDTAGNIYVTGRFNSTADIFGSSLTSAGNGDIYIAKLDNNCNSIWVKQAGTTNDDGGNGIALDGSGNVYAAGYFYGTINMFGTNLTSAGGTDIYLVKLDNGGNPLLAVRTGGTGYEFTNGVKLDTSGNIYIIGYYNGTTNLFGTNLGSAGNYDSFVAKLDSGGNGIWAKREGGSLNDDISGIEIDTSGNIYVVGTFWGAQAYVFGTTLYNGGSNDIYVAKLDSGGNGIWAKNIGGTSTNAGNGMTLDTAGNIYVTGYFNGTANVFGTSLTTAGSNDIFVSKLDNGGNGIWSKQAGGTSMDIGNGITLDTAGNIYVSGYFYLTSNMFGTTKYSNGGADVFVARLDNNGNAY